MPAGDKMSYDYDVLPADLRQLYPSMAAQVRREAVAEADSLDYEGSHIYDMYPDRELLLAAVDRIYSRMEPVFKVRARPIEDGVSPYPGTYERGCDDRHWIRVLIQVIFVEEIHRRRTDRQTATNQMTEEA